MNVEVGGFFGFVLLVLDIWAIVKTLQSDATTAKKVLWIVLVLMLPLLGLVLWFLLGPKGD
ncbi:MAG: PLDc N-terminal domain-containing protein [Pseudomonadota bacterium]|nr:PLDc N-terminal domain-containing protein [Pseudomonadota bacterium]